MFLSVALIDMGIDDRIGPPAKVHLAVSNRYKNVTAININVICCATSENKALDQQYLFTYTHVNQTLRNVTYLFTAVCTLQRSASEMSNRDAARS